jgi:4-hydroxy-3-methylbut-2-enyl diphosphate reductase IspH
VFSFKTKKKTSKSMASFTEKLDHQALAFFNDICQKTFAEQAVAFLNAYWQG